MYADGKLRTVHAVAECSFRMAIDICDCGFHCCPQPQNIRPSARSPLLQAQKAEARNLKSWMPCTCSVS